MRRVPCVVVSTLVAVLLGAPAWGAGALDRAPSVSRRAASRRPAPRASAPESVLVVETPEGTFAIQLFPGDAPSTVANIRRLANAHFYDGLTFHRVVPGFVLQGGDPNSRDENPFNDGDGGPGYTLPAEIRRRHTKGAVAMARRGDAENPARESNGSQFYVALRDLSQLDGAYTVFGQVLIGWDAVERLAKLAERTDIARRGNDANPGKLALIKSVRLEPIAPWRSKAAAERARR